MQSDVMGLLTGAAMQIKRRDGGRAFALLELANNLRLVMRGEVSVDDFKAAYCGQDGEPIDIDAVLPKPVTEPERQLLHILMLDDEPDGDCWTLAHPPFNPVVVRHCEDKGLIEVSERGCRLTNAGRAILSENRPQ